MRTSGLFSMVAAVLGVFALSSGRVCSAQSAQNVSGIYLGTNVNGPNGPRIGNVAVFLLQSGSSVYVSTDWSGYIYNGEGTISGDTLTFQITQIDRIVGAPNVIFGTATISAGRINGITVMPEVVNNVVHDTVGAFSTTLYYPLN
jgi:hypothetical protein